MVRRMRVPGTRRLTLALLLPSLWPAAAFGYQPGVHGDPGSPAGKEYAFPLGQARGIGGNDRSFGTGITRARAGSARRFGVSRDRLPGASGRAKGSAASSTAHVAGGPLTSGQLLRWRVGQGVDRVGADSPVASGSRAAAPSGGVVGSPVLWMLGVAGCVMALGGIGGEALARASRRNRRTLGGAEER